MNTSMGPMVLVVDPDDSLRALFRDLFQLEGYSVDALSELRPESLRELSPAAMIYGLGFGDEPAQIAVLRGLLEDRPAECGAILCTADPAQIATHQTDLASLGIPIVSKPFNIDEVLDIVRDGVTGNPSGDGRLNGSTPTQPARF